MPDQKQEILPRWKIEKTISLGDLVTIILMFGAAATYISKNETDKTQLVARIESDSRMFVTYTQVQATTDAKQDAHRESARADLATKFGSIDTKLDNLTFYLLKGKPQ